MNDEKVGFKFPIGLETAGKTIRLSDEFERQFSLFYQHKREKESCVQILDVV